MTVSNTTANRTQVTGNGVWDDITISWPMFQNSNGTHAIQVIRTTVATGATSTLAETTDYTVALDGTSPNTGVVTLVAGAPSSAYRYTVIPNIAKKQEVDLQNAVQVDMPTIEAALDKLTLITQAQDELLSRAVVLSEDTQITDITLPSFGASDANKLVAINSDGTGMTTVNADELVSVSSFDINSLTAETTVAGSADYVAMYDASAAAQRKVLIDNLPSNISGKTALTSGQVDTTNDMLLIYDASAATNKKVAPGDLGLGNAYRDGEILDIQTATKTDTQTISFSTPSDNSFDNWTDITGLSVTLTPTHASSKIIVGGWVSHSGSTTRNTAIRVVQGSAQKTELTNANGIFTEALNGDLLNRGAGYCNMYPFYTVLDAVNLQSRTIKVQIGSSNNVTVDINKSNTDTDSATFSRHASHLWVMEVAQNENATSVFSKVFRAMVNQTPVAISAPGFAGILRRMCVPSLTVHPTSTNSYNLVLGRLAISATSTTAYGHNFWKNESQLFSATTPSSRNTTYLSGDNALARTVSFTETLSATTPVRYELKTKMGNSAGSDTALTLNSFDNSATMTSIGALKGISELIALNFNTETSGSNFKQIQSTTSTTTASSTTTNATYYDPSFSVSITPTSASSYLLISVNVNAGAADDATVDSLRLKLQRDGSDIFVGDAASNRQRVTAVASATSSSMLHTFNFVACVAAGSTSATTFKVLLGNNQTGAATNVHLNKSETDTDSNAFARGVSQISVIEILPS